MGWTSRHALAPALVVGVAICASADPAKVQEEGDAFRDCEVCPQMVVVPAGSFMMGSPESEPSAHVDERPQHRVTIGYPFAVGVYEVTFEEWDACARSGKCDEHEPDGDGWGGGKFPVVNVSWEDAWQYADWLSAQTGEQYRLLSEAEWEYAARAGNDTPYSAAAGSGRHGVQGALCEYAHLSDATAWYAGCRALTNRPAGQRPAVVGSYRPNAFGLYDMAGNVWEWVDDWYHDSYLGAPTDGSAWRGRASHIEHCVLLPGM